MRVTRWLGDAVGEAFSAVGRVRHGKPIHPHGELFRAEVAAGPETGTRSLRGLLGAPSAQVVVRLSKSAGLPGALPDVLGMAIRFPGLGEGGGPWDLLLATTGRGVPGRFLLHLGRDWFRSTYTSLLPYRWAGETVVFAALPDREGGTAPTAQVTREALRAVAGSGRAAFVLAVAPLTGSWRPLGRLRLREPVPEADRPEFTFDPMVNGHPALRPVPGWVAEVRRRVYARAQQGRRTAPL